MQPERISLLVFKWVCLCMANRNFWNESHFVLSNNYVHFNFGYQLLFFAWCLAWSPICYYCRALNWGQSCHVPMAEISPCSYTKSDHSSLLRSPNESCVTLGPCWTVVNARLRAVSFTKQDEADPWLSRSMESYFWQIHQNKWHRARACRVARELKSWEYKPFRVLWTTLGNFVPDWHGMEMVFLNWHA